MSVATRVWLLNETAAGTDPAAELSVNVVALTVAGASASENVALTGTARPTPVAPSVGVVAITAGAVSSGAVGPLTTSCGGLVVASRELMSRPLLDSGRRGCEQCHRHPGGGDSAQEAASAARS